MTAARTRRRRFAGTDSDIGSDDTSGSIDTEITHIAAPGIKEDL